MTDLLTDTNVQARDWKSLLDAPWKIGNEILRLAALPVCRWIFLRAGVAWGPDWRLYGVPILMRHRGSQISIGSRLQLRSTVRSNPLGPNHPVILCTWAAGAQLRIGADFGMTGGSICAAGTVEIGDRVTVGANTVIADTDFHPIRASDRRVAPQVGRVEPIRIEDDVFIGMNCLILKGVTLGAGCVVGAGSVVTKSVPSGAVVAGNPAQTLRRQDG